MTIRPRRRRNLFLGSAIAFAVLATPPAAYAQARTHDFDVPAQDLGAALRALARQSGEQVIFEGRVVRGKRSTAVTGAHATDEAVALLLRGTGLQASRSQRGILVVTAPAAPGEDRAGGAAAGSGSAGAGATPEILVVGARTGNVDIRRTEDDTQAYVVFGRSEIENSQASSINDFFRARLPMNTVQTTPGQARLSRAASSVGSEINLRGLGTNQTLVLVDGRRMPSANGLNFGLTQPDINGIPLATVERIEVLPATAGGIYGGSATGGVINIITRRDYSGIDISATYGNTFRGDFAEFRLDGSAGFSLEGGRTRIMISGSYSGAGELLNGERDFVARARALQQTNNPAAFATLTAPPFGYTTNICTAASATATTCTDAPLVLRATGQSLGSNRTFVPVGYAGPGSDNGAALLANAGQYNLVAPDDTSNGARGAILASPTVASASFDLRREFSSMLEAYANMSWQRNEGKFPGIAVVLSGVTIAADAPNNPFTTPIRVRFPTPNLEDEFMTVVDTLRANGGLLVRLPGNWSASFDYIWARSRSIQTFSNVGAGDPDGEGPGLPVTTLLSNGTLDVLRDVNTHPIDYGPYLLPSPTNRLGPADTILNNGAFRISGPLLRLPGGDLTLTGLLEYRDEAQRPSLQRALVNTVYIPSRSQTARSAYAEARLPLISPANNFPMAHTLELQASIRHDAYRTRQPFPVQVTLPSPDSPLPEFTPDVNRVNDTLFTFGLRYQPIEDITVRASYGTGFLPPSVTQIADDGGRDIGGNLIDPKRGGVRQPVARFQIASGHPDLKPESSTSWSAGLVLTPRFVPGLRLSADYVNIRKTNEIRTPTPQQLLDLEDFLPERIIRDPLEPDAPAGFTAGPIRIIDARLLNVARTNVEAVDLQADYVVESRGLGTFRAYAVATWQPTLQRKFLPETPFIDSVGFSSTGSALEWRGNAGLDWTWGAWSASWNAQYYDSHLVYAAAAEPLTPAQQAAREQAILNQGSTRIRAQTYHDLYLRYRFGSGHSEFLNGTDIVAGVQNIFDSSPPIIADTGSTDGYSTYGDPRLRRFTLSLRKHF
ncbi:TonB-dependent receptor [Altererythrobacter soli]|uniref:TonB-dependent receptor n=1 Tax=Croceibacterium soli TaxID=1739690 RepID=A0A6I4UUG9_9SPHN|nr:TonB-dependent receptor [Croceibacterium soli]MXP41454.1 TonB-dependent receptor [Croceibacterium soli]